MVIEEASIIVTKRSCGVMVEASEGVIIHSFVSLLPSNHYFQQAIQKE